MNKTTRRTGLGLSLVLFVAALPVSWPTQGTGVVRNDLARNISIPDDLTMPLQVKAAYNGRDGHLVGIYTEVSDALRWLGWEVFTTFYVPHATLAAIGVITLLLVGLGLWGRRASASPGA